MLKIILILSFVVFASCDNVDKACLSYEKACNENTCMEKICKPLSIACKKPMCVLLPEPTPIPTPEPTPSVITEKARFHGYSNPDRPTWYFSHNMNWYPGKFEVEVTGCDKFEVINNGTRYDKTPRFLVKQSDVSGRGMALLLPASCESQDAYVRYSK